MLEFLRSISEHPYDTITFISGDKKDSLEVMANCYKDGGTKIGGSKLGDSFDIIHMSKGFFICVIAFFF